MDPIGHALSSKIAKAVVNSLSEKEVKEAVIPAAAEVGKSLLTVAKAVNIALAPLEAVVWGFERVRARVVARVEVLLSDVPPDQISAPPLNVAGPAFVALPFVADNSELHDLFAGLIASSMISSQREEIHPAYVEIAKQLAPVEARILRVLSGDGSVPLVNICLYHQLNSGEVVSVSSLSLIADDIGLSRFTALEPHFANLARLGLIEYGTASYLSSIGAYTELESDERVKLLMVEVDKRADALPYEPAPAYLTRGHATITDFGWAFVKACRQADSYAPLHPMARNQS